MKFFSDIEATKIFPNTNFSLNNFCLASRQQKLKTISNISIFKLFNKESNTLYNFHELSRNLSWNLSQNEYLYLMGCANTFLVKYRNILSKDYTTIPRLFNLKDKGSKKIRKFLVPTFINSRGFISRRSACGLRLEFNDDDKNTEEKLARTCHLTYIPTFFRSEFVKFIDNTFLYNGALNKIDNNIFPGCRFCVYNKLLPPPKETLGHLSNCGNFEEIFCNYIGAENFSVGISLNNFFLGLKDGTKSESIIFNVVLVLFFNLCFKNKTLNKVTLENLKKKLTAELRVCRGASKYFDGICNLELGLKPDWTLIKKSSSNYTGIFDNG